MELLTIKRFLAEDWSKRDSERDECDQLPLNLVQYVSKQSYLFSKQKHNKNKTGVIFEIIFKLNLHSNYIYFGVFFISNFP